MSWQLFITKMKCINCRICHSILPRIVSPTQSWRITYRFIATNYAVCLTCAFEHGQYVQSSVFAYQHYRLCFISSGIGVSEVNQIGHRFVQYRLTEYRYRSVRFHPSVTTNVVELTVTFAIFVLSFFTASGNLHARHYLDIQYTACRVY